MDKIEWDLDCSDMDLIIKAGGGVVNIRCSVRIT
jgi:hypothetical protein